MGGIGFVSSERNRETLKMERLKKLTIDHSFDLICLSEVNKDWRVTKEANTIWNGTKGWSQHRRVQVSTNRNKPPDREFKVGGTAMVAFDDIAFHITSQSEDDRNLGRWSMITITGKNGLKTTIITCYCPVASISPGSAYAQHLNYIAENKNIIPDDINCPRQLFGNDLRKVIRKQMDKGEQLIVCGDFNSEYDTLSQWFIQEGLRDLIGAKHGKSPITYQRSRNDPIDCVFGTPSVTIKNGGCLAFTKLMSDHRGIWFDIPNEILLGFNPPPLSHPDARRLKMNDPRIVDKYNEILHDLCLTDNLYERWNDLHIRMVDPMPEGLANEYEALDTIQEHHMNTAEMKCRKIHNGEVPWSPTYKKVQLELDYWRMRYKHKLKIHYNVRQLIVLQNKLKLKYEMNLTLTQVKINITACYKKRNDIKMMAESLSMNTDTN